MKKPLGGAFGTNLFDVCQDRVGRAEARRTPRTGTLVEKGALGQLPEPNPSECVKCLEGNPMLHLYSTVLLAVIAANALVVFLAIVGVMNSRKHDR